MACMLIVTKSLKREETEYQRALENRDPFRAKSPSTVVKLVFFYIDIKFRQFPSIH